MENLITIIESSMIMLLAVFVVSAIRTRFPERPRVASLLIGCMFLLAGYETMENAVELMPGFRTDARAAVIVVSGAVGGPISAAITAIGLALWRLHLGGMGAQPGAAYILCTGLAAAMVYYWWFSIGRRKANFSYAMIHAVLAGTIPVVILYFLSNEPREVFIVSNALMAPVNFGVALLVGLLLQREQQLNKVILDNVERQEQIKAIADNAPSILFQIRDNRSGKPEFTYISNGRNFIDAHLQEAILDDFQAFEALVGSAALEELKKALKASKAEGAPLTMEVEAVHCQGGAKYLQIDAGVRRAITGRTVWDGTISDVSERKQAERMKEEFISNVSHELRTPLTSIRGSIGLVVGKEGQDLPPRVLGMLDIANRNAERLVLLINDILDMQKIESGQMKFSLERHPLRPILDQAVISAQSYAPEKDISIALLDDTLQCVVKVDDARLHQVLMNLLSNAIKFSPKGARIIVAAKRHADKVRISVEDQGPGIPEGFHAHIFQRFRQVEGSSTRSAGGTGLGLNISKAITEAMQGTIDFESTEGVGSSFFIDLPASDMLDLAISAADRRIMVCSNDPVLKETTCKALDSEQVAVHTAPKLETALDLVTQASYLAILVDISAPPPPESMAGLQQVSQSEGLALIMIESEGQTSDVHAQVSNDVEWLRKPLDEEHIWAVLRSAMMLVPRARPKILYIEDDVALQEVISFSLEADVDIVSANTLAEARVSLTDDTFDLILLDIGLPDGSGAQFLGEIPAHLPVVIFSAIDITPQTMRRAASVLVKSRHRESDVAAAIMAALPKHLQQNSPRRSGT